MPAPCMDTNAVNIRREEIQSTAANFRDIILLSSTGALAKEDCVDMTYIGGHGQPLRAGIVIACFLTIMSLSTPFNY